MSTAAMHKGEKGGGGEKAGRGRANRRKSARERRDGRGKREREARGGRSLFCVNEPISLSFERLLRRALTGASQAGKVPRLRGTIRHWYARSTWWEWGRRDP